MMDQNQLQLMIERYAGGPELLTGTLAKAPAEALKWRPAPGKWSIHEIVVHCADSESSGAVRLRYLLAEPDPVIVGYDQDAWAKRFDYHSRPLEPAIAAIRAVRGNTVPILRNLPEGAVDRVGRHTESGPYGFADWIRIYAEHLEIHSQQIERNLAAWSDRR